MRFGKSPLANPHSRLNTTFLHRSRGGKPYDLLAVEQRGTDHLLAHGVAVPRIITADPDAGLVVCEWCGDQTLDDICQTADPNPFARSVIHTLCALEKAFHHHPPNFASRIAPGCGADAVREHWRRIAQSLGETLPALATPDAPDLLPTWTALVEELARATPALGPTDYNARNIACPNSATATVLELAKIGCDWPERRLVQYTTSLGAHHPNGRVVGLLTPSLGRYYANFAAQLYQRPGRNHPRAPRRPSPRLSSLRSATLPRSTKIMAGYRRPHGTTPASDFPAPIRSSHRVQIACVF